VSHQTTFGCCRRDARSIRFVTVVDDLDALVAQIADRGVEPSKRETYSDGVCMATYHDPDGNKIGFGGAPL
jgi:predicted enzyme related to lactoylglutathione lyase